MDEQTRDEVEKELRRAQDSLSKIMYGHYNDTASTYERHLMDDCQYTLPSLVAKLIGPIAKTHKNFLELAVGPGNIGSAIKAAGHDMRLTAGDFSENMLKEIDCDLYAGRIQLEATHPMPFRDHSFDGAMFILLMEHITDPYLVLEQVTHVVRPGGFLIFTFMPSKSDEVEMLEYESTLMTHPQAMVHREIEATGFTLLKEIPMNTYIHGDEWRVHNLIIALKE